METDFNFFDLMGEEPKAMMPSPIRGMVNPDIDLVPVPDLLMSVLEEEDQANPESWLVRQDQGPVVQRAGATELESRQGEEAEEEVIPLDHYSKMDDICVSCIPLHHPTPSSRRLNGSPESVPPRPLFLGLSHIFAGCLRALATLRPDNNDPFYHPDIQIPSVHLC